MPQMGESIAEGTIIRWFKKAGEFVERDEPLFEISTDKVDAEIPAPAAGILTEITAKEGETVPVHSVVATIGGTSDVPVAEAVSAATPPAVVEAPRATTQAVAADRPEGDKARQFVTPLVRRIAREHNVDLSKIRGSGEGGRVTKHDVLDYVGTRGSGLGARDSGLGARDSGSGTRDSGSGTRDSDPGSRVEIRPLSIKRKKIAEHMVMSRRTSAHAHTVFHVDFSTVERIRREKKAEYERAGVKLTYVAFIAKAVVAALGRFHVINASLDGTSVIYKKDVNLGIAVALEDGLIVPVVKGAHEKTLLELSRAVADVADRARSKRLTPDEVHDGTFTITNPGQLGAQFGLPIINQPQVAILGVGTIERRPVVVEEAVAIRTMAYLTLGFDHRLIDGVTADEFMADITRQIEAFDPSLV